MKWQEPDWHKLYHELLYEVKPHSILDKRTHQQAHQQAMHEARFLRMATEEYFTYRDRSRWAQVELRLRARTESPSENQST